ncbi:capsid assembly protein [uncultured Mediterranean phage uvMED]|nr:capsid assembly protein [uncultured Mediterranean phage uvMED]
MSSENQEVATTEQAPALSGDTNTPTETTDWKASLSDEIRADKSLENINDIESLAKSYVHAQKLVGTDKIPVPNKHATEEDWNAVYSKLGRPETADGYKFNLPEDQKVDENGLKVFADHAHKLGLLPNQAEGMVKFYNEMQANQTKEQDSTALAGRQKAMDELQSEWGQAYKQKVDQANNVVASVFPPGFMSTNLADGTKLGDHPAVIKAFADLASKMGEDKIVQADGPTYLTPKQIDKEIATLQQPGSAYWDKNHPNHKIAVEEVQSLFEQKHAKAEE